MALFQERLRTTQDLVTDRAADVVTAGAVNDVSTASLSYLRLTAATSVGSFANPITGKHLVVVNANSVNLTVSNNSGGTAGNRILTGTGADATLAPGAAMLLIYDDVATVWRIAGNSFSAAVATGFSVTDQLALGASATITLGSGAFQAFRVQGASGAISLSSTPFGGSAPGFGTGAIILLIGNDNTNTVFVGGLDAAKGILTKTNVTLGRADTLMIQYNAALDRYVEVSRDIQNFPDQFPAGISGALGGPVALPLGGTNGPNGAFVPAQFISNALIRVSATQTVFRWNFPYNTGVYQSGFFSFTWHDGVNIYQGGAFWASNASTADYYGALVSATGLSPVTAVAFANNLGTMQVSLTHAIEGGASRFGSASWWVQG